MKNNPKILILSLILTSLLGYLEWGTDQQMFLLQGEADILVKLFRDPASVLHPFILLPLFGQVLLLIALFQNPPRKWLIYTGMSFIGLLLLLILVVGLLAGNVKTILSALPFLFFSGWMVKSLRSQPVKKY